MVVTSVIVASQGGIATATSGSVIFSEYVEGSGDNQALELYNATAATVDLSSYTIEIYADGANIFSPTNTVGLIGTLGSGDTVVVVRAGSSLPGAFQAGSLIFDGNDAIVLRDGSAIVDVIGQVGLDDATEWGTGDVSTQDNTLRRIASVCDGRTDPVNTFDPSLEWTGFALDTFDGLGSHSSNCLAPPPPPAPSDPLINEFVANHAGPDTNEFVEVSGDASTDYSAFTVLALEGDTSKGVIDGVFPVGSTDASGYWTTGFVANVLENGTQSLLLVEGFTGAAGDDLDTDDDGVLDVTPWTRVVDDVAVNDGGAGDQTYSSTVLDTVFSGGSFAPGGASRIPDSTDTDAVADWLPNDFSGEGFSGFSGTPVDGEAVNTPGAVNVAATTPPPVPAVLVINEVDYDQPGTDTAEFIEILNVGGEAADLSQYTLELFNGNGDTVYNTIVLSGSLAPGAYYVVCGDGGNVDNCDQVETGFSVQNGAPDGLSLVHASEGVVDSVSYEGVSTAFGEGSAAPADSNDVGRVNESISRIPDGTDTDDNGADFALVCSTPGAVNVDTLVDCEPPADPAVLVINEIDYDQVDGDAAEFVEIMNVGGEAADLSQYTLDLFNGNGDVVYNSIVLSGSLAPGAYYVVCGNAAEVANCDLDSSPDTNFLQNGSPDGVSLVHAIDGVVDSVAYEDTSAAFGEGTFAPADSNTIPSVSISRLPDGIDTDDNGADFALACSTSGAANVDTLVDCEPPAPSPLLINEVDADQAGTDSAEFIELFDGGVGNTDLTGLSIVLYNGSNDQSYRVFDLDGYSTNSSGYFVLCGNASNTSNCDLDVSPDTNLIQNGADAVVLLTGNAGDYPNGSPLPTGGVIDALVYDTGDADDAGLLGLLNPGQPQVDEDATNSATESNGRCANGTGGALNTNTYTQGAPTPGEENDCGSPPIPGITLISAVQGSGATSPFDGQTLTVQGVVTAVFQGPGQIGGFTVQEEDTDVDADPATSEGIYVFSAEPVTIGEVVTVTGDVTEFFGLTEITGSVTVVNETAMSGTASPTAFSLPMASMDDFEAIEGMLLNGSGLVVTEVYNLGRFGEFSLAGERLPSPTQVASPGAAANAQQAANDLNRVDFDDTLSGQNPLPVPYVNGGTLRGGELVDFTGVMFYSFGDYTIQPVGDPVFTGGDRPTTAPDVGGDIQIAAFNVLNYFNGDGTGGGFGDVDPDQRGADSLVEFNRQRDKIIAAIVKLDAEVIGLMEIENDGFGSLSAIVDLVDGLNAVSGAGTYAFVNPGGAGIGTDAIAVGLLYKPAEVTPLGAAMIFDSSIDPAFNDDKNRAVLTQSFTLNNGRVFTAAVNHLKSKGSDCDILGDPDIGDGQGNCNITRTTAAAALASWLASDPTGSGSDDVFILGDLNAYAMEDPITTIEAAGYTNTLRSFTSAADSYTYVFRGQWGSLDYIMASTEAMTNVTGAAAWRINADEPRILDYNTEFGQSSNGLYVNDEFRASDHDPVVIGYGPPAIATIPEIQGSGSSSPFEDADVITTGVVTGDFQDSGEQSGFYMQDPAGDGDPATSDGIFVYYPGGATDVQVGDLVEVIGTVDEFFGMTQIGFATVTVTGSGTVTPTDLTLPVADREPFEGMLLSFPQDMYVSDTFNLHRFGEAVLSSGERQFQPTNNSAPAPGFDNNGNTVADSLEGTRLLLDDGSTGQFPTTVPYLGSDGTLRLGDSTSDLVGVLGYGFGSYRLHPTAEPTWNGTNPRPAGPDVEGDVIVATLNMFNYWTTIDDGSNGARGADSVAERLRQQTKMVTAVRALGADIIGLQELENNGDVAVQDLVDALNAAEGATVWATVAEPAYPGGLGSTNAIKVGIIYRLDKVSTVGLAVADDDPIFAQDRPPIAQTFTWEGDEFTVVVNHFKSKSSRNATGADLDQNDGQAAYNARRTAQAVALLDFVAELQASTGDDDVLVIGDFNSYAEEDPITTLDAGLDNLTKSFIEPSDRYSFTFFGMTGLLDYAFSTESLTSKVSSVDIWHINSDEPRVLDFNDDIIDPAESGRDFNQDIFDGSTVYRSADHDPVLVGLEFESPRDLKTEALERLDAIPPTGNYWWDLRIKIAMHWLEASLNSSLWEDDWSLTPRIGQHVFRYEEYTARVLHRLEHAPSPLSDEITAILELMAQADYTLAEREIAEAIENGGTQWRIDRAERRLRQGQWYWDQGRYNRAIQRFRWAWRDADRATAGHPHMAI